MKRKFTRPVRTARAWCYHCKAVIAHEGYDSGKVLQLRCPQCHCWMRKASVTDGPSVGTLTAEQVSWNKDAIA